MSNNRILAIAAAGLLSSVPGMAEAVISARAPRNLPSSYAFVPPPSRHRGHHYGHHVSPYAAQHRRARRALEKAGRKAATRPNRHGKKTGRAR